VRKVERRVNSICPGLLQVDVTHLSVQGIMEGFANSVCRGRLSGVEKKS